MNHEKIFIKENGDKVKVLVCFYSDHKCGNYRINLMYCPKGKRKFISVSFDGYSYRNLSLEDRKKYEYEVFLTYLSSEQITEAKLELWEKLKPTL